MKKLTVLFYALTLLTVISCLHNNGNIDISYSESDRYYSMEAHFSIDKTRALEEYMDDKIGEASNMSFVKTTIDGRVGLDDHTTFYIKKYPGFVKIKLDKFKNSDEAYSRIRSMCEGIGKVVTR